MRTLKKVVFYINAIHEGGAERVMINLARQFAGGGVETLLITSFVDTWEYSVPDGVKRLVLDKKIYKSKISRNLHRIFALRKVLKKEKPDCVISFMAEPNYRSLIATFGLKTKTVISVRNSPKKEYPGKVGSILAKILLPTADGCVFQTNDAKEWFVKKLQDKSVIIPNAIADKFYGLEWHPIKGNIITIGRLVEQKNHKLLISAFEKLHDEHPDITLSIYGSGNMESELESFINESNLSDCVFLKGPTQDVPAVLQDANMFVMSSDYEGMPNALMEALTVGVPCVSTDCPCGGPKMLIQQEENGLLVQCGDLHMLYQSMKKLYEDELLQNKFHSRSVESMMDFKENAIYLKWNEFVNRIIN